MVKKLPFWLFIILLGSLLLSACDQVEDLIAGETADDQILSTLELPTETPEATGDIVPGTGAEGQPLATVTTGPAEQIATPTQASALLPSPTTAPTRRPATATSTAAETQPAAETMPATAAGPTAANTPLSGPEGTLVPTQQALVGAWQAPITAFTILETICTTTQNALERQQAGELDADQLSAEILVLGVFVTAIEQGLERWTPTSEMREYLTLAEQELSALETLITQWSSGEISSEDAARQLETRCEEIDATSDEIKVAAGDAGLEEESLEALIADIQRALLIAITPTPAP